MTKSIVPTQGFRASPIVDFQIFISADKSDTPPNFSNRKIGSAWVAADQRLPVTRFLDASEREFGIAIGFVYSEFIGDFISAGEQKFPIEINNVEDLEKEVIPKISGSFILLTNGQLPSRLYLDHAGSMPIVYSADDRRAASTPALLLDEDEYKTRFLTDLHEALIVREGNGAWISGTLTAHRDVHRLLANHYLDLTSWKVERFWPRPGEFDGWRDFATASSAAADAIKNFSDAVFRNFKTAATLTAGFDTRLVLAGSRGNIANCQFFTIEAPHAEIDVDIAKRIAARFGLTHKVLPLRRADADQTAVWDRTVGDCIIEAPRFTYPTLWDISEFDVQLTGAFGEIGRCRYYRQDLHEINSATIDARFVVDRLTLPPHPELIANIQQWLDGLAGQPNSVILDIALHELKLGSWAMGQRPIMTSVKISFMPFTQRIVFDAFIGVAPADKGTKALFWAMIERLWPELKEFPINKYGDLKDQWILLRKLFYPNRLQRLLRDRFAKKASA